MALESYITSIQHVEISLSSAQSSNSANLAEGTDISNCIPIVSYYHDYNTFDRGLVDVYFSAGTPPTITIERSNTTGIIEASIFIIEFDGTNVEVQQGTFSISGTTDQETISSITTTKAFAVHYWKAAYTDDWADVSIKCWFSDSTHIDFEKHNSDVTCSGHYYIAEAQGTEFTTQELDLELGASASDTQTITEVDTEKTMIIANFESTHNDDNGKYVTPRVWLSNSTTITAERYSASGSYITYILGWVIEFSGSSNISVQRGDLDYGTTDSTQTAEITAVTEADSIINPTTLTGYMKSNENDNDSSSHKLTFVDSDTIQGDRDVGLGTEAWGKWEVISFTAAAEGWSHKFLGVANANINKILGVEKSSINKVIGV